MNVINLNGNWNLYKNDETDFITATVPGCVHTDLINNGLIKDIFYRNNADDIQWIENQNWKYERSFTVDTLETGAKLVFEGLDVYCDVYLNGKHLGYCDDMFISYSFGVDGILKSGENTITVCFYSPIEKTKGKPSHPAAFTNERLHTRRIQCTYGWDWMQRYVTFGIIKDAYIIFDNVQRCENAYIYTKSIDVFSAQICVEANFVNIQGKTAVFKITHDGNDIYEYEVYADQPLVKFYVDITNPDIWKLGTDNKLYTLTCTVGNEVFTQTFGIRTAKILQIKDPKGSKAYEKCLNLRATPSGLEYDRNEEFSSFELILNGKRVMCKGANWVPCEPFVTEESDEKITRILELARAANVNMIRVWGGGVFEKDHFYNECDRLGISVTQDFLMACGNYPEKEDWFVEHLSAEAKHAVCRLRNHPCLMWWSGDNENAILGCDSDVDYQGRRSALEGVAPVLAKYDYMRPFLPSSPYGGKPYASKTAGTTHNTQFMGMHIYPFMDKGDKTKYKEFFKEFDARFIAEEACYGAADIDTLLKFMTEDDIYNTLDMWYFHSKTHPELEKEIMDYNLIFSEGILGKFQDSADRIFKLRYNMYEWMRVTLERARRSRGFCNGIIYWMLNDCWPAAGSWSIIDYYNNPKSGYYSFKRCADTVALSFDKEDGHLYIYLCNDSDEQVTKTVKLMLVNPKNGETVKTDEVTITAAPQSSASVCADSVMPDDSTVAFAYADDKYTFYKNGNLEITKCDNPEILEQTDNSITLKANNYTHVVALTGGIFEDNYFFMQKGEVKKLNILEKTGNLDIISYTL